MSPRLVQHRSYTCSINSLIELDLFAESHSKQRRISALSVCVCSHIPLKPLQRNDCKTRVFSSVVKLLFRKKFSVVGVILSQEEISFFLISGKEM